MLKSLYFSALGWLLVGGVSAFAAPPVDPATCIGVKYFANDSIRISPDGRRVAYLVKSANLDTNQNDFALYVEDLSRQGFAANTPLITTNDASQLVWIGDGREIALLSRQEGKAVVILVETVTGRVQVIGRAATDIREFSIDRQGETLVFATEEPRSSADEIPSEKDNQAGLRIPFRAPNDSSELERRIFVTRRTGKGEWTQPAPVVLESPFTGKPVAILSYTYSLRLSLSPNGRIVLVSYLVAEGLPQDWLRSKWVQEIVNSSGPLLITVAQDLASGTTSMPFATPWAYSITPSWSPDSASFLESASAPAGSKLESEDEASGRRGNAHLFWVSPSTGKVQIATGHSGDSVLPLSWSSNDAAQIQIDSKTVVNIARDSDGWHDSTTVRLPLEDRFHCFALATDGHTFVGTMESPTDSPRLFLFRSGESEVKPFVDINPELQGIPMAHAEEIHWKTSTGFEVNGILFKPDSYDPQHRYPLVIQTQPNRGAYVCDGGDVHFPSFCPQPLASSGILYLIRTNADNDRRMDDQPQYPKEYPGGLGEAAFYMDMWDSAVEALAKHGIVDRTKVGMIGFSRTGWYTEFALAHGKVPYAAATLADNVQYSLSEYWQLNSESYMHAADAMYGGPPYGKGLENWLKYSVSFTLSDIRTPILLETMGHGVLYKSQEAPPIYLSAVMDLFAGLQRLGKPVEWYYYPNEEHTPDHPLARLASVTRNVDWYRFWLTGYEDPNPAKAEQYKRWRDLRESWRNSHGD